MGMPPCGPIPTFKQDNDTMFSTSRAILKGDRNRVKTDSDCRAKRIRCYWKLRGAVSWRAVTETTVEGCISFLYTRWFGVFTPPKTIRIGLYVGNLLDDLRCLGGGYEVKSETLANEIIADQTEPTGFGHVVCGWTCSEYPRISIQAFYCISKSSSGLGYHCWFYQRASSVS